MLQVHVQVQVQVGGTQRNKVFTCALIYIASAKVNASSRMCTRNGSHMLEGVTPHLRAWPTAHSRGAAARQTCEGSHTAL